MVYDVLYGRNAIVARVNKKTYTLRSVDGLKFTHDKTFVRRLDDQTVPPNLIQYAGAKEKTAAAKPARGGQTMEQNVTLVETWTQGEDSFRGAETKTGKTYKNLTQAQALKRIKDNPRKNYDIYVGGERVMLWSGAGRPFRVEYSPELKSKQAPAPKATPTAPKRKPAAKPKKQPAKPKTTKKPAAPKARKPKKTAAAKPAKKPKKPAKLTASQREYLAIQGFVMVKRGGKYVKITK